MGQTAIVGETAADRAMAVIGLSLRRTIEHVLCPQGSRKRTVMCFL